jgi:hypothetical protein
MSRTIKAAKPKPQKSLITGRDPESQLYRAVERYVKSNGGGVLVIGGIQVQEWPGDFDGTFTIGVRCTGKKPSTEGVAV